MKINIKKLKQEQLRLAKKVVLKDSFDEIKLIGGVDQAFVDNKVISLVAVMDYKTGKLVERKYAVKDVNVPYIPGFLAYREMPSVLEAFNKLENKPDILLCDCNGILHPRKIGMASHIGLILEIPTIGVAKRKLLGVVDENKKVIYNDQVVGVEVLTKQHAKPIYVSPGHMVSFKTSEKIVKGLLKGHKLPEPLYLAHKFVNNIKKKVKEEKDKEKNAGQVKEIKEGNGEQMQVKEEGDGEQMQEIKESKVRNEDKEDTKEEKGIKEETNETEQ